MVSPQTSRPRGRPPYDFLRDPERYAMPFIDALVVLGTSETDAFKIAAAQIVGIPMGCRTVDPRRKRGRGLVGSGVLVNYDNCPATIVGKADTLRRKFKRPMSPTERVWRLAMGRAFLLALRGKDWHRCGLEDRGAGEVCGRDGLRPDSAIAPAGGQILYTRFYARRSD
jgi:hypothetical protein